MRQYVFQSAVDLVALSLGLVVLSLVSAVANDQVLGSPTLNSTHVNPLVAPTVLVFSLILTAVHWYLRPLLVIFFGSWLIRSFGLFALILDIGLFYLAILLAPIPFSGAGGTWWWITAGAILFNIADFAVGSIVGVNRPRLDGKRAHDAAWRQLERLPSLRRNWLTEKLRLEEALSAFVSYGLEIALADTTVGQLRRWFTRVVYGRPNPIDGLSPPAMIRVMLEQLGPTYIKFGQIASSQSQTLPPEWAAELARLQSDVPPAPYEQAREVIISELGAPPEDLYAAFEHEALAAASTAQVHKAVLRDGTPVAVKIQRPNIVAAAKADLGLLHEVSSVLENVSGYARDLDLSAILDEFSAGVVRELDYRNEAYHAVRLEDIIAGLPLVRVPKVYPRLSGSRVLTMELINGVKLEKGGALEGLGSERRLLLTQAFTRALVKQIFIDGFFHGDPHPGNILLDLDSGGLTYLDLGLVGRLDQSKRLDLIDLLFSIQHLNAVGLANVALRVSSRTRRIDVGQFRDDMAEMLNQYVRYVPEPKFDATLSQFLTLLQRHGLRLDPQFMLAIKAVAQSEAVVAALGGDFDFVAFAIGEIKSLAVAELTRDKVLQTVTTQVTEVGKEVLRRVPNLQDATVSWLDQFLQGKLVVHVDTKDLTQHVDALGTSFSRLAAALVVTGMIIGTAIVTTQLWAAASEQRLLLYVSLGAFILLLITGWRLAWQLLHPPRRPYVE